MDGKITKDTATEYQKRSAESRKKNTAERKAFKEWIDSVLNEDTEYNGEIISNKYLIAIKAVNLLLKEDLDAREFARLFEVVRDTIGEKPIDKVQFSEVDQSVIDEVEAIVLGGEEEPKEFSYDPRRSNSVSEEISM